MTAILAIWSFLKSLPWQTYLVGAALLAIAIGVHQWDNHIREAQKKEDAAQIATLQAELTAAQSANAQWDATVAALTQSVADCEKGRRTDSEAMDSAKRAYAAQLEQFKASDAKVRTQTAQRLATTCAAIANQPSCVTAP